MHRMIKYNMKIWILILPHPPTESKSMCICKIWDMKETIYTDQTEKSPVQSNRGHRYIMVMAEIDANYIDAETTKKRMEDEIIRSYQVLLKRIKQT